VRILVVNPNSTESMTATIGACAGASVGPGVRVDAVSATGAPAAIESHVDEALAVPGVLEAVRRGELEGYDAHVLACFGDPGLMAAREVATGPVVGIAEAAMRTAAYLGRTFSVVTTLARTVGHTVELTHRYGVAGLCAGVHACDVPVLDLEHDPLARATVLGRARQALAADGSEVLVLGCAGMADFAAWLSTELGVPVVDGVAAATAEAEKLVRLGLRTSKVNELAYPPVRLTASSV
jgi:allantoin racemase